MTNQNMYGRPYNDDGIRERKLSINKLMRYSGFNYYSISGMIDRVKVQLIDNALNKGKLRYGEEIYLSGNEFFSVHKWIEKYDNKFANRNKNNNGILGSAQFFLNLDENTLAFIRIGSYMNSFDFNLSDSGDSNACKIYIFGKKYKKYMNELKDSIHSHDTSNLYIYNVKGDTQGEFGLDSVGRVMTKRDINTLFFNDHIKETVCGHIDGFLTNKEIYESKNLTYKTGILLYGPPGTGKSSLATALATKYDYNIIVIDMATFADINISTLTTCINADTDKYIILLEDIDTLFETLDRTDKETPIDKDSKTIINKMLQFLDSTSSPNNVIFIATTNHIDKLDKAIIRDGRFDLKLKIDNIDTTAATEMIKSFQIDESEAGKIIDNCTVIEENGGRLINPAELQNKILAYVKENTIDNTEVEL